MNTSDDSLFLLLMILSLQLQALIISVDSVITGSVLNEINIEGRPVKIHCESNSGHDLGYHDLKYAEEFKWEFYSSVWSDTRYTCHVLLEDSIWYFFDAFHENRDYDRCIWSCKWLIRRGKVLLGFNEGSGSWEKFYFSATELAANVTSYISEAPAQAPAPI